MVDIKVRTEEDLAGCVKVLQRVYDKDGYPVQGTARAHEFLKHAISRAWVAEQDGQIIGHVAIGEAADTDVSVALWKQLHPREPCMVLERLFVDPGHRGTGAAAGLMEAAAKWSGQMQTRLVLFGLIKDQVAIRMYRRLGWESFGTVPYHYGDGQRMDAVCFSSPDA